MVEEKKLGSIALLCDPQGAIVRVLHDDLGLAEEIVQGRALALVVDRTSLAKTLNFLGELHAHGAAFNWELNVPLAGQVTPLYFGGRVIGDNLFIIGARSQNGVLKLYEDMIRISKEQANVLGTAIKEQVEFAGSQPRPDNVLYDEISRLNNELVTLQQELAKKNAEQARMKDELRRLHKLKDLFLSITAHDLRAPLGNMQLISSVLLDMGDTLTEADTRKVLKNLNNQTRHMLDLVSELLDISRIEAGYLELKPQTIDLEQFLAEVVHLQAQLAGPKNTSVLLGTVPVGTVQADVARLRQVVDNLVSNAIKYSPPASTVCISVQKEASGWRIIVQDQGPGITPQDRQRLFQEFVRLSARPTGGEKSTGLGLAITRRIVEAHGGQVGVDSEPGHGATFWFTLPYEPATAGFETASS